MSVAYIRRLRAAMGLAAAFAMTFAAAGPFTPGNLVVYRVGTGGATVLSANGSPVFLDEYTPSGALVQSIALPTVGAGAQKALLASGTASSDGLLTRSADGTCLAVPGYGRDLGTGGGNLVSGTIAGGAAVPRVVARVAANGSIDVSTSVSDSATATNFRGAASNDCGGFWLSGNAGGVRHAPLGATSSADLTTAASLNTERGIAIFGGQLYVASPSNAVSGIAAIGTGLPTSGTQALTKLNGTAAASSPYSFFLADLDANEPGFDTLYIVDDGIGLMKFALAAGTWTQRGTIGSGADTYRGLTATVSGNTVTLYATRKGGTTASGGGELVKVVDASGYNGTLSATPATLVTAPTNIALRGVALAPGVVTITPSAGPHGSISPATPQVVPGGVAVTFTVVADAGYTASATGCGGTLVGTTFTTALATTDCPVVATFAQTTHTVTPSAGANGSITPNTPQVVADGATTAFNVAANPGYSASATGCGGALSGATFTTAPITADCGVVASFTLITYTVTPSASGNGTITPSTAVMVPQGATTTFTVSPQPGYFATMGGSCDGTLTGDSYTTRPVTADCSVTATFAALPRYTVTPSGTANGTFTPAEPQSVLSGQTTTFTFAAAPGYSTAVRGTCGGSLSGNTFTTSPVNGDCTVRFAFAKKLVLFVGNSYTFGRVDPVMSYNAANVSDLTHAMWLANTDGSNPEEPHPWGGIPGVFKKLTDQAGLDYDVSISARNAATLRGHYLNSNPAGWDLRGNIASQRWDAVVLQDLSDEPLPDGRSENANLAFFNAYVDKIEKWVHIGAAETYTEFDLFGGSTTPRVISPANTNASSLAKVFLYQTWARPDMIGPNGTKHPNPLDPLSFYYSAAEGLELMTTHFHNAYFGRAAANPNIEDVSPVGDAFLRAVTDGIAMRDPYVPDAGKINLWHTDYYHPSKYGSYLSALVHFATITGIDPTTLGAGEQAAVDLGIASAVAVQLQRVARDTVMPGGTPPTTARPFDFNGDGRGDVVIRDSVDGTAYGWLMNGLNVASGGYLLSAGSGWSVVKSADLDGDGKSDILIQHTDGSLYAWIMNGLAVTNGAYLLGANTGWTVSHTGDFNGDGKQDILLGHADGSIYVWLMDGPTVIGGTFLQGAGAGWSVSQVGDFNGDGKSDILLRHTDGSIYAQLMNGIAVQSGAFLKGAGIDWSPTATGDFNGDGKTDILIAHVNGGVYEWLMDGVAITTGTWLLGDNSGWSIAKTGDLDGDGKSDILVQHTDGSLYAWTMNGLAIASGGYLLGANTGFSVSRLLDMNGDGRADILLKHTDGSIYAWTMNGIAVTGGVYLMGAGPWGVVP